MSYAGLLNQRLTISNATDTDDYGDTIVGASTEVKARVELLDRSTVSGSGQVIPIHAKAWVKPTVTVAAGDEASYEGVKYRVAKVSKIPGANGKVHTVELALQEWE